MSDVDELMKEFEISNNAEIWFTDGETWPGMRVNIDEFKAKINRLIVEARIEELERLAAILNKLRVDDGFTPVEYSGIRVRLAELRNSSQSLSNNLSKGKDND